MSSDGKVAAGTGMRWVVVVEWAVGGGRVVVVGGWRWLVTGGGWYPRSGSQDMVAKIPQPGSGSQDQVARIWKPGPGSQDLESRVW